MKCSDDIDGLFARAGLPDEAGGLSHAMQPATTFERGADLSYHGGPIYARAGTPAWKPLEDLMAKAEGGAGALCFASGMAAASAVLGRLKPGDHVIIGKPLYLTFRNWIPKYCAQFGIDCTAVDLTDLTALAMALKPGVTRIVWGETPVNPLWTLIDIAAVSTLTHNAGAKLLVDSTAATPILSQPIRFGADYVLHGATKFLAGHDDLTAGILVAANPECLPHLAEQRRLQGGILGAFEAWLLLRSLRTLPLRVRAASRGAAVIASHFSGDRRIAAVLYPGLTSHSQHDLARRQMPGGYGGLLSFRLQGGRDAAVAACAKVNVFVRATSFGGPISLIEHRASMEDSSGTTPDDLIRLSIGLESIDALIADLEQAFV